MGVFFLKVWDCSGLQKMKVTETTKILHLEGMSRTPNAKACGGLGKRRDLEAGMEPGLLPVTLVHCHIMLPAQEGPQLGLLCLLQGQPMGLRHP